MRDLVNINLKKMSGLGHSRYQLFFFSKQSKDKNQS